MKRKNLLLQMWQPRKSAIRFALVTTLLCGVGCNDESGLTAQSQGIITIIPCRGCPVTPVPTVPIENREKLIKFLAITLNVTEDRILFDDASQEFYATDSPYREALTDLQSRYINANEYKRNFEN